MSEARQCSGWSLSFTPLRAGERILWHQAWIFFCTWSYQSDSTMRQSQGTPDLCTGLGEPTVHPFRAAVFSLPLCWVSAGGMGCRNEWFLFAVFYHPMMVIHRLAVVAMGMAAARSTRSPSTLCLLFLQRE